MGMVIAIMAILTPIKSKSQTISTVFTNCTDG